MVTMCKIFEITDAYTSNFEIKAYENGMCVLDNCMGSGSTGVACVNTNRKFIGIELDEEYFSIASNRIAEAMQAKSQEIA